MHPKQNAMGGSRYAFDQRDRSDNLRLRGPDQCSIWVNAFSIAFIGVLLP